MIGVGDPVRAGFVTNLARPEGNITGNSQLAPELIGKRLEILKDYVPNLARVAFMWNPDNDSNLAFLEELIIAVPALGLQLISVPMRTSDDFQAVIAAMMRRQPNACLRRRLPAGTCERGSASPQDRVILFSVATGIVNGSVGITDHAMQSMAIRGFIAHNRESGVYTLTDSGRAMLTAILDGAEIGIAPK